MTADTALAIILNDTNMVWSSSQCLKLKATSNLFALCSFRRQLLTRKSFFSEIYSAIYVLYLIPVCNQWSMVWKYNYTVYSIKISVESDFFFSKQTAPSHRNILSTTWQSMLQVKTTFRPKLLQTLSNYHFPEPTNRMVRISSAKLIQLLMHTSWAIRARNGKSFNLCLFHENHFTNQGNGKLAYFAKTKMESLQSI